MDVPASILIIGCGYVGTRVASLWREQGRSVTALTRSRERASEWQQLGINAIVGDVLDPDSLKMLPDADVCLYSVGFDRTSGHDKRAVYVEGLRHVLSEVHSRIGRLIYLSSSSVYGQDSGEWVNEDAVCHPLKEGGEICLAAEQLVSEFLPAVDSTGRATVLRLSGIYGPGRLIARSDQLRHQVPLTGNPEAWLNLIHVDDIVQAIERLAQMDRPASRYLLSDMRPVQRREFYETMARLVQAPAPRFTGDREQSMNKRCDSSRIRQELGLQLKFPTIEQGLPDALGRSQI